jgi:hypothetical protein
MEEMICKICGEKMGLSRELLVNPPRTEYICKKCGHTEVVYSEDNWSSLVNTTQPIPVCVHDFNVQFVNGEYVSVCSRCGKIGDTYTPPTYATCQNLTNVVTYPFPKTIKGQSELEKILYDLWDSTNTTNTSVGDCDVKITCKSLD